MMASPKKSDVSFRLKSKMAAVPKLKTKAKITFERFEITTRVQLLPYICDHAGFACDTVDIARPDVG